VILYLSLTFFGSAMANPDIQHFSSEAIRLMRRHGCPPTPHNYAIWYEYARQTNPGLTQELDKLLSHEATIDEATGDYLYFRHLAPAAPEQGEPQQARALLTDILRAIGDFSNDTASYHEEIDAHIASLQAQSGGELGALVETILASARGLRTSGDSLNQSLQEAQAEIESLRKSLQDATHEAQRDFLTGLFNRKAFDRMMDEMTSLAAKEQVPFSLLMIDVDHFKRFNDKHGHPIGDEVLKMVARLLKDTVKGTDIVTRFGGEEFAVILPNTPLKGAQVVAENIRINISRKELRHREQGVSYGNVTVSIGLAAFDSADNVPLLIKRADDALYEAKRGGRNRVSTSGVATAA